ncbi:hypothetical protein TNCT_530341 [Trichonephila clavata]|uniref:Uncharacterized protein n=1 Tax=Trichonephila clavata TaxID=2740835 RepID=A0A8X6KY33_TRICU|nr:hypothetical protein TNCT_530341 [Trichonephila clavata]
MGIGCASLLSTVRCLPRQIESIAYSDVAPEAQSAQLHQPQVSAVHLRCYRQHPGNIFRHVDGFQPPKSHPVPPHSRRESPGLRCFYRCYLYGGVRLPYGTDSDLHRIRYPDQKDSRSVQRIKNTSGSRCTPRASYGWLSFPSISPPLSP